MHHKLEGYRIKYALYFLMWILIWPGLANPSDTGAAVAWRVRWDRRGNGKAAKAEEGTLIINVVVFSHGRLGNKHSTCGCRRL